MRKFLLGASALVGVALLANSAAEAAVTYVPIAPPSGAVTVLPFGINDHNIIAGGYTDSGGLLHGFYGPPDGSNYTTFDVSFGQAEARAILNDGSITGLALASGFTFGEEYYRSPDGSKVKPLKNAAGDLQDGVAQGGNDAGIYVGDYLDTDGVTRLGFEGKAGKFKAAFKLPIKNVTSTNPRQINNNGVVAGGYIASDGIQHGFVLDGKKFTSFDYPGAVGVTTAEGINDAGQVSGLYTDSTGSRHAFVYDVSTGNFKSIDPGDGSSAQEAWGINNKGMVVFDTNSGQSPYIYCPLKKKKCPKGAAAASYHPAHVQPLLRPVNLP
jgi:probable HAF family extracellular repeat protein